MTEKQISGFRLPSDHPLTNNELAWIQFLRLVTEGRDPKPGLRAVQMMQRLFREADV